MPDLLKQRIHTINMIAAAVVVGGIIAPAAFGAFHYYTDGRAQVRQAGTLRQSLDELDGLNKTLDEVEAARKNTESRLAEAETRLPNSQSMDDFLHQIAQVEETAGLSVDSTTFDHNLKDAGGYKSLPVHISGTGKWDTCYRFLTGLRSMPRLTRLDSLTLEAQKVQDGPDGKPLLPGQEPTCLITIDISTFMAR
jgi:Tfp pilus assembly protein PilO